MKNTRRFIAGLSALTMAAAMAMSASAAADTKTLNKEHPSVSTEVTYNAAAAYTVTIPTSVTLSDTADVTDSVSASDVRLEKGKKIVVSLAGSNTFKLAYEEDNTVTLGYVVNKVEGEGDTKTTTPLDKGSEVAAFETDGTQNLSFALANSATPTYAGDYTGSLTFDIAVEGAAATGYVPKLCDKNSDGNYLVSSFYDGTNVLFESLSKEEAQALAAELSEDPAGRPVRLVFEIHPDNNLFVNTVGPDGTTNGFLLSTTNYTSFYTLYYVPKQS